MKPFFFTGTATSEIYTLSLHDALPISSASRRRCRRSPARSSTRSLTTRCATGCRCRSPTRRSEEHTSELQSHVNLVCRLLLEKKNMHERACRIYATVLRPEANEAHRHH